MSSIAPGINTVAIVKNWMKSQHIFVPDDWVNACIQWIQEEYQNERLAQQNLKEKVYEQWLLADLNEIRCSCLPPGLQSQEKTVLNGSYSLQVNFVTDISQPFYSQLLKAKGENSENTDVAAEPKFQREPKPNRMLLLNLTDGVQSLQGMEYRSIPSLNSTLTPGIKVLVSGKIQCRRGMLLLVKENIAILGGEVESLSISNNAVNMLSRALGRGNVAPQIDEIPVMIQTPRTTVNTNQVDENQIPLNNEFDDAFGDDMFLQIADENLRALDQNNTRIEDAEDSRTIIQNNNFPDRCSENFVHLRRNSDKPTVPTNEADSNENRTTSTICLSSSSKLPLRRRKSSNHIDTLDNPPPHSTSCTKIFPEKQTVEEISGDDWGDYDLNYDVFMDEDAFKDYPINQESVELSDAPEKRKNDSIRRTAIKTSCDVFPSDSLIVDADSTSDTSLPVICISDILKLLKVGDVNSFAVRAFISTFSSSLEQTPDAKWKLSVKINDGTSSLLVQLSDKFLTERIGFSVSEFKKLKATSKQDPHIKPRLRTALKNCEDKLQKLSGLMHLRFEGDEAPLLLSCSE